MWIVFLGDGTAYCRRFGYPYCLHLQYEVTVQWPLPDTQVGGILYSILRLIGDYASLSIAYRCTNKAHQLSPTCGPAL